MCFLESINDKQSSQFRTVIYNDFFCDLKPFYENVFFAGSAGADVEKWRL